MKYTLNELEITYNTLRKLRTEAFKAKQEFPNSKLAQDDYNAIELVSSKVFNIYDDKRINQY